MDGARVGVRVDSHALDRRLAAGADDPHRDLAAIGDEHAPERHRAQSGFRFWRNARMPSWPSGDTRWAAMRLVVRPMTSFGLSPATSRISALAAATAFGPGRQELRDPTFDRGVELRFRHDLVDQPELARALRAETGCR